MPALEACVCATLHQGSTNAELENWLRLQRCSNVASIALLDGRHENVIDNEWSMRPWLNSGFLTLVSHSQSESLTERCTSILAQRRCGWYYVLEAPTDVLVNSAAVPPTSSSIPIIYFAAAEDTDFPTRPLVVRATLRDSRSTEQAQLVVIDEASCSTTDETATTADSSTRVHRYKASSAGVTDSWEPDESGRELQRQCDDDDDDAAGPSVARGGDVGWVARAAHALSAGDGVAFLRGAISDDATRHVRDEIWRGLPAHKRTTRVFANHMCQIHAGVPESPGHDAACEPIASALLALPAHTAILALATALLGDGFRLHNAGLSLVTPPADGVSGGGHLSGHMPHQDQPINSASVWGGRVPPPSHPLSLQALWMLDDFTYDNGATYVLPRTHHRTEHIDSWAANQTRGHLAATDGRFPLRFATGRAGDVVLALGSVWHGASTARRGQAPRLALLFEYAPAFVEPRDRYSAALIRKHVRAEEHRRIFPTIDLLCDGGTPPTPAPRKSGAGLTNNCAAANSSPLSVRAWHRLAREEPHCLSLRTRVRLRNSSVAMPIFGLGTGAPDDDEGVIGAALRSGYRLIDTGELYANEEIISRGIGRSGVKLAELVIASKHGGWCTAELPPNVAAAVPDEYRQRGLGGLYPTSRGTLGRGVCIGDGKATRAAFHATLRRLGVERLDLYLLHWPLTHAAYALDDPRHAAMRLSAWAALVELKRSGVVDAIGLSNFSPRQIEPLLELAAPSVLQVELHLLLQRPELRAFCEAHDIVLQSYGHHRPELGQHGLLSQVTKALTLDGKPLPTGLLSMRWALESGVALIPRSRKLAYVADNLRIFDFALPAEARGILAKADANVSLYGLHEIFVHDRVA